MSYEEGMFSQIKDFVMQFIKNPVQGTAVAITIWKLMKGKK